MSLTFKRKTRLLILPGILLLLANILIVWLGLKSFSDSENRLAVANENKVIFLKINLLLKNVLATPSEETRKVLNSQIDDLESTLFVLKNGGLTRHNQYVTPPSPAIRSHLELIEEHWKKEKQTLLSLLQASQGDTLTDVAHESIVSPQKSIDASIEALLKDDDRLNDLIVYEYHQQKRLNDLVMIGLFIGNFLFLCTIFWLIYQNIVRPLDRVARASEAVAAGNLSHPIHYSGRDELGMTVAAVNAMSELVKGTVSFLHHIDDEKPRPIANLSQPQLAEALVGIKNTVERLSRQEKEQAWQTRGMGELVSILNAELTDLKKLGDTVTSFLVDYTGAIAGGIFVVDDAQRLFEMLAFSGISRSDSKQRVSSIDDGLLGRGYKQNKILILENATEGKRLVDSGFFDINPHTLMVIPLHANHRVQGMLELAFMEPVPRYKVEFFEKIASSIASTIAEVKHDHHTEVLLKQSQELTAALQAQEEELRQNVEELIATQEEVNRQMWTTMSIKNELASCVDVLNQAALLSESDLYGNITYVNEKFCQVAKYTPEECMGKPHSIIRHPDTPKEVFKEMWATIKSGRIFHATYQNLAKDGSTYWVEASIAPVMGANGKPVKYIGIRFDVTERIQRAEQIELLLRDSQVTTDKLRRQEHNLQEQFKVTQMVKNELASRINVLDKSALVTESDLYGTITYANQKFCEVTKYSLGECIGRPHSIVRHPDTPKEIFRDMWQTIKNGGIFKGVIQNKAKDGSTYWVDATVAPVIGEDGKPVKYISVRFDITQQVLQAKQVEELLREAQIANNMLMQQEEELRQNNEELRQSKEMLADYNQNLELRIAERTLEISQQRDKLEYQKEQIESSIRYAKRLQEAMLPVVNDIKNVLPESFILFKPRDIVSGDFYWFAHVDNKTVIAAVDCTGHGVPGAFMSMVGSSKLSQIVKEMKITQADMILNRLHRKIQMSLNQTQQGGVRDGMDIALCVIDHQNKTMEFAGANNPLVYIQDNELFVIKGDKAPIGGSQGEMERQFTSHTVSIAQPTTFYIFSDGYQDQFGGKEGKKFMIKNLKQLLLEIHQRPVEEQKHLLDTCFCDWMGKEQRQIDDVLMIGVKV